MQVKLHKNATTTIAVRQAIQKSHLSAYAIAKQYGISENTARRWKNRTNPEDVSSRPHKLNTVLTKEQEELICFERKQFKKTIEDIFFTLEGKIPNLYPMKVYRCLRRYDLAVLPEEFVSAEMKIKKFRKYGIGYLHIDLLYSPKINKKRSYIYTAIDRIAKIAFIMLGERKNKETGAKFLQETMKFYPYKINYILMDNGFEFSYKALPKNKKTKKVHPFDNLCKENKIQHRTIKFKHLWTNGMIENFNKRVKQKVLKKYMFSTIFELDDKLLSFVDHYNHNTRLRKLNYKTPAEYLKETKGITLQRIVS
jgi:transposase-like protein/transposase